MLGNPCAIRVSGPAEHVHEPGADLHHEEDVQPAQRDGVHREEITSQRARGVGADEITPTIIGTSRRGHDWKTVKKYLQAEGAVPVVILRSRLLAG
ncbi:hypothetical protein GCM10020216_031440 [Nonomuraea helvata]